MLCLSDMLNLDSAMELFHEIRDAEKLRDVYLDTWKNILARWVGKRYRSDFTTKPTLENYIHSYLSLVLPQMVFSTPVCSVSPEINAEDTATAMIMEGALNCWMKRNHYKGTLKRMARDMILGWGVTQTGYGLRDRSLEGAVASISQASPAMPFNRSVPIGNHFVDPQCWGYDTRRFEGHSYDVDIEDILSDERFDPAAAQTLAPNRANRIRPDLPFTDRREFEADRKRVTLYEVWVPEAGMIFTLGQTGEHGAVFLRREKYIGPKDGPYNLWGVWEIPGQIYPFSPIAATFDQFEDLNIHAESAQRSARSYKRFGTFNKMNNDDGKAVQSVKHGQMVGLTDASSVKEMEIGGMSQQQVTVLAQLKDRMDRNLGHGDAQQGVTNSSTATANQLTQNNSDLRTDWLRQALVDNAETDLRKIGWYFWNREELVMSITIQDRTTGKSVSGDFYGGQFDKQFLQNGAFSGQIGSDWTDYHLFISPESIIKIADPVRQKRAQDEWQLMLQMVQLFLPIYGAQTLAMFNWRRQLDRYGNAFNEQDYSHIILTPVADQMLAPDPFAPQIGPDQTFEDVLQQAHAGMGMQQPYQMPMQGMAPMQSMQMPQTQGGMQPATMAGTQGAAMANLMAGARAGV